MPSGSPPSEPARVVPQRETRTGPLPAPQTDPPLPGWSKPTELRTLGLCRPRRTPVRGPAGHAPPTAQTLVRTEDERDVLLEIPAVEHGAEVQFVAVCRISSDSSSASTAWAGRRCACPTSAPRRRSTSGSGFRCCRRTRTSRRSIRSIALRPSASLICADSIIRPEASPGSETGSPLGRWATPSTCSICASGPGYRNRYRRKPPARASSAAPHRPGLSARSLPAGSESGASR